MNLQGYATILLLFAVHNAACKRPHICYFLADDLGWNDLSFHGSNQVPTPNIDAMAYTGAIMHNYYVTPLCTPSRATLMTGKHAIHTGMQHFVLAGAEPRGLPLDLKLLPEYLKELGYTNRMVGKWHLGFYTKDFTPTYRGFDSFLGFWTAKQDQLDHTAVEFTEYGLDMRRNLEVARDVHGNYSTDLFTREAVNIIHDHESEEPLFLYVAQGAMHSGNFYNPIAVPEFPDNDAATRFDYITDFYRRKYAGVLSRLDYSVGAIVEALASKKMLEDTIFVFSTDNGGPSAGFDSNAASNWPLRGVKATLWEGGVRGAALVWSTQLKNPGRLYNGLMDISSFFPTLIAAANGTKFDSTGFSGLDGKDLWDSIVNDTPSDQELVIHNIDDIYGYGSIRYGPWKIVKGDILNGTFAKAFGPTGREYGLPAYDMDLVLNSKSGRALQKINRAPTRQQIRRLRQRASVRCTYPEGRGTPCNPNVTPCLYNIPEDPCEQNNLAQERPDVFADMLRRLEQTNSTAVPPGNLPLDPRGFPSNWNYVWTNFGDYIKSS